MRTRGPIILIVGVGALLLAAMTVLIASKAKKAYADHVPLVNINLNSHNGVTQQGQSLAQYTFWHFQRITCDMNVGGPHSTSFDDPCYYRRYVYERDTTNDISRCWSGGRRSFSQGTGVSSVIGYSQNVIPTNCPVGLYTLKGILAGSDKVAVTTRTAEFQVIARPPPPTSTPIRGHRLAAMAQQAEVMAVHRVGPRPLAIRRSSRRRSRQPTRTRSSSPGK